MANYSLEFVDGQGRKVRVAVSGHWAQLNAETARVIEQRLQERPTEGGLGVLGLSDFEESDA